MTSTPLGGDFASKSVAIVYPLLQQCRVRAELVHSPSGTGEAELACLGTRIRVGGSARGSAKATDAKASQEVNEWSNMMYSCNISKRVGDESLVNIYCGSLLRPMDDDRVPGAINILQGRTLRTRRRVTIYINCSGLASGV